MSALTPQRYALGRAFAMVRDRPLAFLLGVALAAVALALPLAIASVLWAARPALALIQPAPEVSVFVSTRAASRDVGDIRRTAIIVPTHDPAKEPAVPPQNDQVRRSAVAWAQSTLRGSHPFWDICEMALAPTFREDFRESLYRLIGSLTSLGVTMYSTVEVIVRSIVTPRREIAIHLMGCESKKFAR